MDTAKFIPFSEQISTGWPSIQAQPLQEYSALNWREKNWSTYQNN
jgi:hypothetical protein